ncbi:hypothetical protein TSUD_285300 [Trifolium subterraneum]|uniref:Uncharacterized protein n=1 Tax=Trifolium subterraneum TaxID=3900 RepID=A0A2Z6PBX9_TRISU|nr:hypothetical protein TSUD_285300 [Trifolium subterraneum]
MVEGIIFVGPQVYPGLGAKRVKFFGSLTVWFEVPASPTITSKVDCPPKLQPHHLYNNLCIVDCKVHWGEGLQCRDFLATMGYVSFEL